MPTYEVMHTETGRKRTVAAGSGRRRSGRLDSP
jgi:hypothetical protein